LQKYLKTGKDQLSSDSCCEAVYKINCQDCETSYVGQTKRLLKIRVNENFRDIKKSSDSLSVLDYKLTLKHEFDWQGVRILHREASWNKRLVSEMIQIKRQRYRINKQSDTLPDNYLPIIHRLFPT